MRYQGKLTFPDREAADVDVSIDVTETHVRLASGEESLGSWCLADVVAQRVVANEFELDLHGESVTFLADDPVNFAYGAVQGMAEGWARYRSMNPVSRKRAVASARRNSEPSRLADARRVFVAAGARLLEETQPEDELDPVAVTPGADDPVEPVAATVEVAPAEPLETETTVETVETVETVKTVETETSPPPADPVTSPPPEEEPTEGELPAAPDAVVTVDEPTPPARVVAGKLPRLNTFPAPKPAPAEAIPDAAQDPVEPPHAPRRSRRHRHVATHPDHKEAAVATEVTIETDQPEVIELETSDAEVPATAAGPVEVSFPEQPEAAVAALDLAPGIGEEETAGVRPVSRTAWRAPDAAPEAPEPETPAARPIVGPFKDGHHPAETTGLRASVKSIFGRSKQDHEHTFVESTTTVGLTRRVCLECGHVSIGLSD
ncbi:MAG TPA: hypothetical protein VJ938_04475 [Acidimicrobiia bacterium]|nr:hypothetical protein [Acidimicrobiia bacterium]